MGERERTQALIDTAAAHLFAVRYNRTPVPESFDDSRLKQCRLDAEQVLDAVADDIARAERERIEGTYVLTEGDELANLLAEVRRDERKRVLADATKKVATPEQIEAVLIKHRPIPRPPEWMFGCTGCDWSGASESKHRAHVSQFITALPEVDS